MDVEWVDIGSRWTAHLRPRPESVGALEVTPDADETYEAMVGDVSDAITRHSPWGGTPWELLVTSEPDRPTNRAMSFWGRHGSALKESGAADEACSSADGWIRRSAANQIRGSDHLRSLIDDPARARFRTALILPPVGAVPGDLLARVLTTSVEPGFQFTVDVAVLAISEGAGVMVKDETRSHEPSLLFLGEHRPLRRMRQVLERIELGD